MTKYTSLYDVKTVQDQAYFILVATGGSWLYNSVAELSDIDSEETCKLIVDNYLCYNEADDKQLMLHINAEYDDLLARRS